LRIAESKDLRFGRLRRVGVVAAFAVVVSAASAQSPLNTGPDAPAHSIVKSNSVQYLYPEQVNVPQGQPTPVALHFRVAAGLHINSHAPREEFLIPTVLSFPAESGVRLDAADYPAGSDLTLASDPGDKLSVYTGDFTIQTRIVAAPGEHLVEAKLHYQACDKSVCLPPKTITVPIDVVGK
jgi:hypothetical protein